MKLRGPKCLGQSKWKYAKALPSSSAPLRLKKSNAQGIEPMPQDNKPTSGKPPECHARKHMGAEFFIYDYMIAACKSAPEYKQGDPLSFHGRRVRIANAVNSSLVQLDESLHKLED